MIRTVLIAILLVMGASPLMAAKLDQMVCDQDEVFVLRFGQDRASKRSDRAQIRFESHVMYAKDANGQEREYPVNFISGPRYEAGNWTMIFNPDLTSADVALVTMTDVQTMKWRCKKTQ